MNLNWKRVAAFGLALLLASSPVALASEAMGNEIYGGQAVLSQGAQLNRQIFWSDSLADLRTEYYVQYTPNAAVTPSVAFGNKVLNRATLTAMAKTMEAQGKRVVSGINGDFYVMATGAPLGMVISDGVLRSSASYHWAIGFSNDGSAFIGKPNLAITATFQGKTLYISGGVNKVRQIHDPKSGIGGLTLFTDDFSDTTQNTAPGVDVLLTPVTEHIGQSVSVDLDVQKHNTTTGTTPVPTEKPAETGVSNSEDLSAAPMPQSTVAPPALEVKATQVQSEKLTIGGRVTCTVDSVLESAGSVPIPAGKLLLSLNGKDDAAVLAQLRALQPGETVDIDITSPDERWSRASQGLGAMYKLVTGGAVDAEASNTTAAKERTARTAIGIKADGSLLFYTMDGKQPGYSVGATMGQIAMRLIELGCVEAVGLDGGGSTNLGVTYPAGGGLEVVGKPADGTQRPNSTAIFLTTQLKPTGVPGSLTLTPGSALLLAGASVQLEAGTLDSAYYPMDTAEKVTYSIHNGDGIITADGRFTAGSENGISTVTATAGAASGTATMTVLQKPDKIALTAEQTGAPISALALSPAEKIDLKAAAQYKGLPVTAQDVCYTWTLDPALGTVDENGVLTAGAESASGKLTVSVGGTSVSVPVNIAGHVLPLETFEGTLSAFTGTAGIDVTPETDLDYVRYGKQSMRVDYTAADDGAAGLAVSLAIPGGETHLGLWVYGDGSQNILSATVADSSGKITALPLAPLDFTGWKHLCVALPAGTASIRTLHLQCDAKKTGVLWLDQLTTANERMTDTTPPIVTTTLSGTTLTATVSDNLDRTLSAASVVATYDGVPVVSVWDPITRTLKADLPAPDGKPHRATVTAVDASGNLGRGSAAHPATGVNSGVFADMDDHWAAAFGDYLYHAGISNGVGDAISLQFLPDKPITRGEFFAMVARWMRLDLTQYDGVVLPFADVNAIPSWALEEVKAMYGLGILKGVEVDGKRLVSADAQISRAEAATILGRTQPRGYAEPPLAYADAAAVPAWALPYFSALVGQGALSARGASISPNVPINRAEVAQMLYTLL